MNSLPRSANGRVAWKELCIPENLGRSFVVTRAESIAAFQKCEVHGYSVKTRTLNKGQVQITLIQPRKKSKETYGRQDMLAAKRRDEDYVSRLAEARENVTYWKRQQMLRTNPLARAEAGARVLIWEAQVKTLRQKLTPCIPTPI